MDHPKFKGAFEVAIDTKHRVLIPLEFRQHIDASVHNQGRKFYLQPGYNEKPWLYTKNYYDCLLDHKMETGALTYDDYRRIFGMITEIDQDNQNRILIPAKGFEWRFLEKDQTLVLVGCGDHLEFWTKDDWYAEQQRLVKANKDNLAPVFRPSAMKPSAPGTIPVATLAVVPMAAPTAGPHAPTTVTGTLAEDLPR